MSEQHFKTLIGEDVPVTVFFDYQPYEPATLEYPGCSADVTVNSVQIESGHCVCELLSDVWLEHIREQCFISLEAAQ